MLERFLIAAIRGYQFVLSPWVGGSCRFWPTCSDYAREAIETHGAARGTRMMLWRLARCHPYSKGGFDPVAGSDRFHCGGASGASEEGGTSA